MNSSAVVKNLIPIKNPLPPEAAMDFLITFSVRRYLQQDAPDIGQQT